jgi:hypothetical protein
VTTMIETKVEAVDAATPPSIEPETSVSEAAGLLRNRGAGARRE